MHMQAHICDYVRSTFKQRWELLIPSRQHGASQKRTLQADAMLLISFSRRLSAMLFISQLLACLGCADIQVRRQSSSMN